MGLLEKNKKKTKQLLLAISLLILDQLTKVYFTNKNITLYKYFSINYITNTGIAFGLLKGANIILTIVSTLIIITLFYFYKKTPKYRTALTFIISGATGNLIDRITKGYVIDFIDLKVWPVFNLADFFISIGFIILILQIIREKD